jgi:hypothetical protein
LEQWGGAIQLDDGFSTSNLESIPRIMAHQSVPFLLYIFHRAKGGATLLQRRMQQCCPSVEFPQVVEGERRTTPRREIEGEA